MLLYYDQVVSESVSQKALAHRMISTSWATSSFGPSILPEKDGLTHGGAAWGLVNRCLQLLSGGYHIGLVHPMSPRKKMTNLGSINSFHSSQSLNHLYEKKHSKTIHNYSPNRPSTETPNKALNILSSRKTNLILTI